MVSQNHDCHAHYGEPVTIGGYPVMAGGIHLSETTLAETEVLMTLCDRLPPNLGSREVIHRRFAIEDFGVSPYLAMYLKIYILRDLAEGRRVTIHCQGGFGRTGMVLGGLIALLEPDIDDPVAEVRKRYCPRAIETPAQESWVRELREMTLANQQAVNHERVIPMSTVDTTSQWYMAGTEGTGEYLVIASNEAGRIGIRKLAGGTVRIRIEPTDEWSGKLAEHFTVADGWKQPDIYQQRFSKCLPKGKEATNAVASALKVLKRTGGTLTRQPSLRFAIWRLHTA